MLVWLIVGMVWAIVGGLIFNRKVDELAYPNGKVGVGLFILACGPLIWGMATVSLIEMLMRRRYG